MPRTCLACAHAERAAIDTALAAGQPFRDIAGRFSLSRSGLHRHKDHVAQAIVKASEKREESLGANVLAEAERLRAKAWELLKRPENEGDTRGAVVALREARECLGTIAGVLSGKNLDLASVSDDAILEEARRRGLNIHGQYVLTERERREAEESIKTILANDSDAEHPLLP
jgi:hypothetical protein